MTGGIFMLIAYGYALRKYVPFFRAAGRIKHWMKFHIFLGITGPILVMVHSTTHIGSVNGGMALISMLLVVLSGVIGRYIYARVHFGLYGQKAQLKEIQQYLWLRESNIRARLSLTPNITKSLQDYEQNVAVAPQNNRQALGKIVSIRFSSRRFYRKLSKELQAYLYETGKQRHLKRTELRKRAQYAKRMLRFYLQTLQKVVEYSAYERLLRAWRMVHVPLLYVLITSGIVHVIAVHMY